MYRPRQLPSLPRPKFAPDYMTYEVGKALLNKPRVNMCYTKGHEFVTDWAGGREGRCRYSHSFESLIPLVGGCVT